MLPLPVQRLFYYYLLPNLVSITSYIFGFTCIDCFKFYAIKFLSKQIIRIKTYKRMSAHFQTNFLHLHMYSMVHL